MKLFIFLLLIIVGFYTFYNNLERSKKQAQQIKNNKQENYVSIIPDQYIESTLDFIEIQKNLFNNCEQKREQWGSAQRLISQNLPTSSQQKDNISSHILSRNPSNMTDFLYEEFLGDGGFSSVFLARDTKNDYQKVVAKIIKDRTYNQIQDMQQEIQILEYLKNKNIPHVPKIRNLIKYNRCDFIQNIRDQNLQQQCKQGNQVERTGIVFDFVSGITIKDLIGSLNELDLRCIFYDIFEGLAGIHKAGILHNDIKSQNIVYDIHSKKAVLLDFGLAEYFDIKKGYQYNTGTQFYISPEKLMQQPCFDYASDIWSVGITMVEMTFKVMPSLKINQDTRLQILQFFINNIGTEDLVDFIEKYNISVDDRSSMWFTNRVEKKGYDVFRTGFTTKFENADLFDLFDKIFTMDFAQRITAEQALKHKYFDPVRAFKQGQNTTELVFGDYYLNFITKQHVDLSLPDTKEQLQYKQKWGYLKSIEDIIDQVDIDFDPFGERYIKYQL